MIAILTISSITLSGCIQVDAQYPAFEPVDKPELHVIKKNDLSGVSEETLQKLLENDQRLKDHGRRLQAQIDAYMEWREEQE